MALIGRRHLLWFCDYRWF